jgi:sugar phosphate isomerase/epimerase
MIALGIISDEVGDDLAASCARIASWGLRHVELRQMWGKNIVQLSDGEVDAAVAAVHGHGLTVTAVASPVFKSPIDERPRDLEADFALEGVETLDAQMELLERACELARRFGTRYVRVFSFWRQPWDDEVDRRLVDAFRRAAEVAERHEVVLAIENEPVCLVGTGRELARLWRLLQQELPANLVERVGLLWDPGNALAGGEDDPYPGGYRAAREGPMIHVHLKDLRWTDGERPDFVPLGDGLVDYRGQLAALREDGYDGAVVLEPHYAPPDLPRHDAAYACVEATRRLLADAGIGTGGD